MSLATTRRKFLAMLAAATGGLTAAAFGQTPEKRGGGARRPPRTDDAYALPKELAEFARLSLVLGRVTDRAVTASALSRDGAEGFFEYGPANDRQRTTSGIITLPAGEPVEMVFGALQPDTEYFYRLQVRRAGETKFGPIPEGRFHTQRAAGRTFTFSVQGDSHPERPQMSEPNLYARTLLEAASRRPDFHVCMGDDFSVARIRTVDARSVAQPYLLQRPFLGLVGRSAPIFLLNGNHEQASLFNFNQTDVRHELAVGVQNARNRYYPTPAPDGFYSGDTAPLQAIGLLKDYYAWTWGDALFVVLDNYWQSPALVDTGFREDDGGGGKRDDGRRDRDWWGLTLGDEQYRWFKRTLEQSRARHKFVFAHHVLGSGRGGVDECELFEWGGRNKRGEWEFARRRPGWELPIHQLMVKHGVAIFFQGHDHLYARQERDGVVYQTVPLPADPGYVTYNEDRFRSGMKLPNSGHLHVTVSPEEVTVDYVRSYLKPDETVARKTGDIAHRYTLKAKV